MQRPPTILPRFFKAHGHGNDYLVFEQGPGAVLSSGLIQRICDRWRGPGGDGVVVVESSPAGEGFRLRMFNPDGGEFEQSGNGLRVAGVYLRRSGRVGADSFPVVVAGDQVWLQVRGPDGLGVYDATAAMGRITFPRRLPFVTPDAVRPDGLVDLCLDGARGRLPAVPVSVGNPHAVIFGSDWSRSEVARLGPFVATHRAFPQGANVQFAEMPAEGSREISVQIWERGVGRTSASGTSACAVVAAAVREGLMPAGDCTVRMDGGAMEVRLAADWSVRLRGPVEEVFSGELAPGFLAG